MSEIATSIREAFVSDTLANSRAEPANIVDGIANLAQAAFSIANAITPRSVPGRKDEAGQFVESLTEAVMGMTAGICRIADAISELASAVNRLRPDDAD